ncbi:MAG TPA: alpha-amylase family glycosyl hydrolase [Vicinamibacterales bacterium]
MLRRLAVVFLLVSCTSAPAFTARRRAVVPSQPWNHEWARGAVFYEIFPRSFYDSDGDGIGDLNGITAKLDYLKNDLGVDALWLTPIFESPSYHGYDTTNYEAIGKDYGTKADFDRFLAEAHKRGIRVILDFVMNHTSSQHPWFLDSASSTTSAKRDWYVWSATDPGWHQPWGGDPSWHPLNGAYYYGVFWSGMPDLNYRTPAVKDEMFRLGRYWLGQGVDGFRLDATRYLVETGPGPGQSDTAETHQVLKDFATTVRQTKPESILVAENTTDIANLARYYADDLTMNFNFPLAAAVVDGVNSGNSISIVSTLRQELAAYPKGFIDAPFLTNHDQTRIATVLRSDPGKLRSAAAILLTLPGAPFVYYGEELGMQNGPTPNDEAKRTPMPWTPAGGFTTGTPWFAYAPGTSTANVTAEINDPQSLLSYYRSWIAARKRSAALTKGDIAPLDAGAQLLAFVRDSGDERVLVVHNVSGAAAAAGPLPVSAGALEAIQTDPGVGTPSGGSAAWSISMPAHSSGVWRLR